MEGFYSRPTLLTSFIPIQVKVFLFQARRNLSDIAANRGRAVSQWVRGTP